jgi:predicted secreted protein
MAKYSAFGTTLTTAAGAIVGIQNIGGPKLSTDTIDVTAHDSPGSWEESIATILRSGELTLDIVYDPAEATQGNVAGGLLYNFMQRAIVEYTLGLPDTGTSDWVFDGIVTGFELSAAFDGALTASVTIKVTGAPTIP